ncbi:MAG: hypothetical protein ACYTF0_07540, partial [Planctomycetota bacterium]
MATSTTCRILCLFTLMIGPAAAAQDGFLNDRVERINQILDSHFSDHSGAMVIGLVDEHGSRVFSAGKLSNGTEGVVDGNTIFELGSVTKVFTALLLA